MWLALASALWGCTDTTGDTGIPAVPHGPDLPVEACGPETWSWLPTDGLGTIVDHAYASDLSWTADAIVGALRAAGVGDIVEPLYDVET
jgi:hypothetical protein